MFRETQKKDVGTEVNVNYNHQLYYHLLGTKQSEDILCWNDLENPTHILEARLADDGKVGIRSLLLGRLQCNGFNFIKLNGLSSYYFIFHKTLTFFTLQYIKLYKNINEIFLLNEKKRFFFLSFHQRVQWSLNFISMKCQYGIPLCLEFNQLNVNYTFHLIQFFH